MTSVKALWQWLIGLVVGTVLIHITLILFGATVIDDALRTASAALIISALSIAPLSAARADRSLGGWLRMVAHGQAQSNGERRSLVGAGGALAGAWTGAILLPLDWGYSWLQWPLPPVYGACLGHAFVVAPHLARQMMKEL